MITVLGPTSTLDRSGHRKLTLSARSGGGILSRLLFIGVFRLALIQLIYRFVCIVMGGTCIVFWRLHDGLIYNAAQVTVD